MWRRLLTILPIASLLACGIAVTLWVRSHYVGEYVKWDGSRHMYVALSAGGKLIVGRREGVRDEPLSYHAVRAGSPDDDAIDLFADLVALAWDDGPERVWDTKIVLAEAGDSHSVLFLSDGGFAAVFAILPAARMYFYIRRRRQRTRRARKRCCTACPTCERRKTVARNAERPSNRSHNRFGASIEAARS